MGEALRLFGLEPTPNPTAAPRRRCAWRSHAHGRCLRGPEHDGDHWLARAVSPFGDGAWDVTTPRGRLICRINAATPDDVAIEVERLLPWVVT